MRRRDFVRAIVGSATAWPLTLRAQQSKPKPIRRVSVRIDYRWGAGDTEHFRKYAAEIVGLSPDLILGTSASIVRDLQAASRTIPIVFVTTIDPVGSGLVASFAHSGGNATGFAAYEFSQGAKLLELLKQIAPNVTRVAVLRDPFVPARSGGFAAIQTAAPGFGVELIPVGVHDGGEIERGVTEFAHGPNGGLIVVGPTSSMQRYRDLVVDLAARYRLPAVYAGLAYASTSALMSYDADWIEQYRRAASYVDRILKGERPALPVQAPTKYRLVINLKSAKELGLTVPPTLLATADVVIE